MYLPCQNENTRGENNNFLGCMQEAELAVSSLWLTGNYFSLLFPSFHMEAPSSSRDIAALRVTMNPNSFPKSRLPTGKNPLEPGIYSGLLFLVRISLKAFFKAASFLQLCSSCVKFEVQNINRLFFRSRHLLLLLLLHLWFQAAVNQS